MRKVLSFVLVLALVLSSFSMAFAADTATNAGLSDIAETANEDAIQVCNDLGIIDGYTDGTFKPTNGVTRAEFAAMMTRALAIPSTALAGYTGTSFKDTTGYGWAVPYLAFCESKGIMLGDGNGYVRPGDPINVNEAVTMALRAVGYTANSAVLTGIWPANYVSVAQNEGLYDDVADVVAVDRQNAAQIIYNLLTVQKVAVNSDGETKDLFVGSTTEKAVLLNTGLGCKSTENVIIDGSDYDRASMNITPVIGASGTIYTKDVDGVAKNAIVAFTKDSTALTGKIDDGKFKVGDKKYDFEVAGTDTMKTIKNTTVSGTAVTVSAANITAFAAVASDDDETVTLNVDLSGSKIKDVYSVVGWIATDNDYAPSDVQEDIADADLLTGEFDQDDDDNIITAGFKLIGVASLDKIAEDNVVYIYEDGAGDIRQVVVGTETVEGTLEEYDEVDVVTIEGTDYDVAYVGGAVKTTDFDPGDEGKAYFDGFGCIYEFDATAHKADTYALVVDGELGGSLDDSRVRLYLSSDDEKNFNLAEKKIEDLEFVGGVTTNAFAGNLTAGGLIGYSLDSDGDIDTLDITAAKANAATATFQSINVFKTATSSFAISADCVVFTYDHSAPADSDKFDVATLGEVNKGTLTGAAYYILNDDDDVVALLLDDRDVDVEDDDVYGVFNSRTAALNSDDDNVFKFKGFIDGTEFTKLTDDRASEFDGKAGKFEVYKITVDANDVITAVAQLGAVVTTSDSEASGSVVKNITVDSINSARTVITEATNLNKWTVASDAVVYCYDEDDDEFTVSSMSKIRKDDVVSLYDTKGDDADGIASLVIFIDK